MQQHNLPALQPAIKPASSFLGRIIPTPTAAARGCCAVPSPPRQHVLLRLALHTFGRVRSKCMSANSTSGPRPAGPTRPGVRPRPRPRPVAAGPSGAGAVGAPANANAPSLHTTNQPPGPPPPPPPSVHNPNAPERGWSPHRLLSSDFKSLGTPPQVGARFLHLLLRSSPYLSALLDLLRTQPGATKDFSLEVDALELIQRDPVLGNMLLRFPATLLPLLEDAIVEAQRIIKRRAEADVLPRLLLMTGRNGNGGGAEGGGGNNMSTTMPTIPLLVKGEGGSTTGGLTRIHARLTHLPPPPVVLQAVPLGPVGGRHQPHRPGGRYRHQNQRRVHVRIDPVVPVLRK